MDICVKCGKDILIWEKKVPGSKTKKIIRLNRVSKKLHKCATELKVYTKDELESINKERGLSTRPVVKGKPDKKIVKYAFSINDKMFDFRRGSSMFKSRKFYNDVKNKRVDELSKKQLNWLKDIENKLKTVKVDKRRLTTICYR